MTIRQEMGWVEFEVSGKIVGEDLNSIVVKCDSTGKYVAVEYGDAELPEIQEVIGREVEAKGIASISNGDWFYAAQEISIAKYGNEKEKEEYIDPKGWPKKPCWDVYTT